MKSQLLKQCLITIAIFAFILIIGCSDDNSPSGPGNPIDPGDTTSTVTDIDGNVYRTVKIGNQVWMAENLKVTHYRNGDSIPNVTGDNWEVLRTGAYCNYNNDANNGTLFGRLYNAYAVADARNIAPLGWHVASDAEWQVLIGTLGGDHVAGGKLKEAGTTNWSSPNTGATNESGFNALPAGRRGMGGETNAFVRIGYETYFWTSTIDASYYGDAYYRVLIYDTQVIYNNSSSTRKTNGYSVRCIKD